MDTLGVSCSLHISPWSSPTTEFSGDSMACVSVGASPLTPTEMMECPTVRGSDTSLILLVLPDFCPLFGLDTM